MNRRDTRNGKTFARRAVVLAGGQLALFSLLGARLYHLQVVEADRYRVLSDENRIDLRLLEPRRGRIVDRTGAELAMNRPNYCLVLAPEAGGRGGSARWTPWRPMRRSMTTSAGGSCGRRRADGRRCRYWSANI